MKIIGEKCNCGHYESEHVNENKKFYEPNKSHKIDSFMTQDRREHRIQ